MNLIGHLLPPLPSTSSQPSTTKTSLCLQIPVTTSLNPNPKPILLSKLLSLALAATLSSPLPSLAIPSLNSQSFQLPPSPTTPFSESKTLETGLENGKIRPCPSTNPGCVSTNPKSSSFAFPWTIPENSSGNAIQPSTTKTSLCLQIPVTTSLNPNPKPILLSKLLSLALAATLSSPLPSLAIPSLNSQSFQLPPSPTTPFSESKTLETGLENGKIRPCPSTNPGCVSTNPKSSSFAFPWTIPENSSGNAIQKLQEAILKTQKNAKIQVVEDTPNGQYLQAEVDDGGFGRDVLEFLVKGDVVAYRSIATKVTYVYPFTTALGDSKGQEERMKKIIDQLGWYAPSFDTMD
ncbi:thylakoid lumenal 17.9 kda protein [Quercus suber]|uniref:Thylakoid lumenal 17.9 kDa protein n=1 Tax=Quercus suber TaxID=58331 RepID=A0AAW0M2R4_QUESU